MKKKLKSILKKYKLVTIIDFLVSPITLLATIWLKIIRIMMHKFKDDAMIASDGIFMRVGILPVRDHYYQPMINPKKYLRESLKKNRDLPGVNYNNVEEQLSLLSKFNYSDELITFPEKKRNDLEYFYNNGIFGPGDSEYLYSMIRYFKPGKIIEIGCGHSTLMIKNALKGNKAEDASYQCNHIGIEPYELKWLDQLDVIRKKVEDVDLSVFADLKQNDILFIDSSHMIRPQGDVLFEFLQVLPILKPGVLVHIHDIFTPNEYPDEWLTEHLLWNEQYLLEAFLCYNDQFKVIGALNFLFNNHTEEFVSNFPIASARRGSVRPASFWIVRK